MDGVLFEEGRVGGTGVTGMAHAIGVGRLFGFVLPPAFLFCLTDERDSERVNEW